MKLSGKQLYGAAVFALVLPTGWAFHRWVSSILSSQSSSSDRPSAFHGTRLGMSVDEVRSRFVPATAEANDSTALTTRQGSFSARPNGESGWALDWQAGAGPGASGASGASGARATVRRATFEFHDGLLVAVRAEVDRADALSRAARSSVTAGTVRRVTPRTDAHFDVLILARACPAHAEEVRNLLRTP